MPFEPDVFGNVTNPSSSKNFCTSSATSTTSSQSVPGIGSRSMRSSSGDSVSVRREGHGWKSRVPWVAAQATCATSTGHSSRAVRPEGNETVHDSIHGGAWSGSRFW